MVRRSLVGILPFVLGACGLILDFDGFSDRVDGEDAAVTPSTEAGAKDTGALPEDGDDGGTCPRPEGSIGCEVGTIDALAATNGAVLWMGSRGPIAYSLTTRSETVVGERATPAIGRAVAYGSHLTWGYQSSSGHDVERCEDTSCGSTKTTVASSVVELRRLVESKAGLYAWLEEGSSSRLVSLISAGAFDASAQVTHFMISDTRAYWRIEGGHKQGCRLPNCSEFIEGPNGQAPFGALSADEGFVSAIRSGDEGRLKKCPPTPDAESCDDGPLLPFDESHYDKAGIFASYAAFAVADDVVYIGGADGRTIHVGKAAVDKATDSFTTYVPIEDKLQGKALTALAVNGTHVYFAVKDGEHSVVYERAR